MSCGCRTGVPQNENVHRSNEILMVFCWISSNVHRSKEILRLLWFSGSKYDQILNITLLLPLLFASDFYGPNWWSYENVDIQLVLPSLLDRPTFWLYVIFVVGFGSATRSPNEPPGRPKGTKWLLKAFPGTSNDYPRTPQGCNLLKFCIDVTDCQDHIKSIFCLGSRAGIIIIKKTSVWGFALG